MSVSYGNSVNTSSGVNNDYLQVKSGTISKCCFVCGNGDNFLKDSQKVNVNKPIGIGLKVKTISTASTGTVEPFRKCKRWQKNGGKYHHTTDTHCYKTNV